MRNNTGADQLRAIRDHVIIRRTKAVEKIGSIVIAQAADAAPTQTGTIVAVGPGVMANGHLVPTGLKVGELVQFGAHVGQIMEHDGEPFVVMRADDIAFVIDPPAEEAAPGDDVIACWEAPYLLDTPAKVAWANGRKYSMAPNMAWRLGDSYPYRPADDRVYQIDTDTLASRKVA